MNLFTKLFTRREDTMTATGTETDSVLAQLEENEAAELRAQAERIAREQREGAAYRARNAKTLADFLKRKDRNTQEVNTHVAGLLLALTDTATLVIEAANIPFDGTYASVEDVFGFPLGFPHEIIAAIHAAAPRTEWDYAAASPIDPTPGQPKLKGAVAIRTPRFYNAAPPGFNGAWDPIKGEPVNL